MGKKKTKIDYIDYKNQIKKMKKIEANITKEKIDDCIPNKTNKIFTDNIKETFMEQNKK